MATIPTVQVSLEDIQKAKDRLEKCSYVVRTPLVKLRGVSDHANAHGTEVYLKLENLQPTSSFKVRGASNVMLNLSPDDLTDGICTASTGNFAQGLAWAAKEMGVVPCNILIPDHTPQNKRQAMEHYNGVLHPVPYDTWWKAIIHHGHRTLNGYFVHPAVNSHLIAGNGTIGLEILEDMPDIDAVVMPYGGGGLSCGVATVMKSLKPSVRCYATEVETAAPLSASLKAGHVVDCDYTPNFVDGIGGKSVLPEIFDLASRLLDGSLVVSLSQTANALKLLVEKARIVAEGAGAAPVAAALAGMAGHGKIVCVVSGGNIDGEKLIKILQGQLP